jgi:hypothetical protein
MQLIYNNFFDLYVKILEKYRNGKGGEGIRWITTIDKDNIDLVKILLNAGVQVRHLKNLTPMNFGVDDRYFYSTIEKMEGGKMIRRLLTSNEPIYINHCNSIFEELWKNGVDAAQRIRDIEEGADIADIEVFRGASRAREIYLDLVKAATKEILFIFPTLNAFSRQIKIGAIALAEKAATERNVSVKVLMPANKSTNAIWPMLDYSKLEVRRIEQTIYF